MFYSLLIVVLVFVAAVNSLVSFVLLIYFCLKNVLRVFQSCFWYDLGLIWVGLAVIWGRFSGVGWFVDSLLIVLGWFYMLLVCFWDGVGMVLGWFWYRFGMISG